MDWKKWSSFFGDQCSEIFNDTTSLTEVLPVSPIYLDHGDAFSHLEEEYRAEVERAVRKFARSKKWPKLSKIAGALLNERLMFAFQVADQAEYLIKIWKTGPVTRRMTDEQTIRWFLIEAWEKFGFENQMNTMRCVPYPFGRVTKPPGNSMGWLGN